MVSTIVSFFPRAVMQGIPLLFGSTGEILTEKSGNLNLGIPGIMYVGGICGVIGAFFYEQAVPGDQMNGFLAIMIPMLCSLLGSLLMGLLYCFLTVTLRANQNVTGLAMTTFGVGVGNFFGGSLIKLTGSEVPSIALANTSRLLCQVHVALAPTALGWFGQSCSCPMASWRIWPSSWPCWRLLLPEAHPSRPAPARPWAKAPPPPTPPASTSPSISTWPPASAA